MRNNINAIKRVIFPIYKIISGSKTRINIINLISISFVFSGSYLISHKPALYNENETKQVIQSIADAVLKEASFGFIDQKSDQKFSSPLNAPLNSQLKIESPYNDWRYWNGVLSIAMLNLGSTVHDSAYINFAVKNIEFAFNNYDFFKKSYTNQDKWNYPFGQLIVMDELDDFGAMGASLIEVNQIKKDERYSLYVTQAANLIKTHLHRLEDGTLVRAFPRKWTLWADDLYMSISLLSRLGEYSGDTVYYNDAAAQVVNFNKYLFDKKKGLMYHCWYSDTKQNGVAFWGRANGWALLAQAELLDRLPKNHPMRKKLLVLFQRHIKGVINYQDKSGLWHQLLDKSDSYLETSSSAMFTYAIARGINRGYLAGSYASVANQGWKGILTKIRPDGKVEGVCTGTGIGDDLNFYYNRPAPLNDPHGTGAVLLAGTEILKMNDSK
jgi:unsaturated rhamnogalacturonyl hydrolase